MDALQRVFQSYDEMRSEGRQPQSQPVDKSTDQPPWMPIDEEPVAAPVAKQPPKQSMTSEKAISDAGEGIRPSKSFAWEDTDRKELDRLNFGMKKGWSQVRAEKEERAQQIINDRIKNPQGLGASFVDDEQGLSHAYSTIGSKAKDTGLPDGNFYDDRTHTLYVAGSSTKRDWWDDVSKIPWYGDLREAERYNQALDARKKLMQEGKDVDRVVGHSLGGSVALELQKRENIPVSRTYGAPVFNLNPLDRGSVDRWRHPLDPFSVFDRGAHLIPTLNINTHSYGGY